MGEHVHALTLFPGGNFLNDFQTMPADGLVDGHVLIGNLVCAAQCRFGPLRTRPVAHGSQHLVERPFQIDRGRPRPDEHGTGAFQRFVGCIGAQSQPDAIGRSGPDQRRTAHLHGFDRTGRIFERGKPHSGKAMRQLRLVDNADACAVAFDPNAAHLLAVDFHG